jgi:glycine hydroxymethyltransferase
MACVVTIRCSTWTRLPKQARREKPKLIIAGGTAYSRVWDFKRFREIADEVGAYLLVDMAHFAGLVAGGAHPSPIPHAHVVTTTTHKSLRGPRGGMILTNDEDMAKKMNIGGVPRPAGRPADARHRRQGGRLSRGAAARVQGLCPQHRRECASALAEALQADGLDIVSGGTDNHLMLVDLRPKDAKGKYAEKALDRAAITCNKNGIPFDPEKPAITSGIRLGTPAGTTRGFGPAEFREIGGMIAEVVDGLRKNGEAGDGQIEASVRRRVEALCARFPIYPEL